MSQEIVFLAFATKSKNIYSVFCILLQLKVFY